MNAGIRKRLGGALVCLDGTDWLLSVMKWRGKVRPLVEKFEGLKAAVPSLGVLWSAPPGSVAVTGSVDGLAKDRFCE